MYFQYLLSSQTKYTCKNLAEHVDGLDHNSVYRYLKERSFPPSVLWEKVKDLLLPSESGYLLFDDTLLAKSASYEIEGVGRQYSGSTHGVVKGIRIVNLVYYKAAVGSRAVSSGRKTAHWCWEMRMPAESFTAESSLLCHGWVWTCLTTAA